jgi:hypothetical protein
VWGAPVEFTRIVEPQMSLLDYITADPQTQSALLYCLAAVLIALIVFRRRK